MVTVTVPLDAVYPGGLRGIRRINFGGIYAELLQPAKDKVLRDNSKFRGLKFWIKYKVARGV